MSDQVKRLYRARDERMLAGVCGGLGKYFGLDATLIRVAFALLALLSGAGIIAYIILAIVMPNEPEPAESAPMAAPDASTTEPWAAPAADAEPGSPAPAPSEPDQPVATS